jgi:hypothetical protein
MAKQETLRSMIFPSGILSIGLGQVERQVPADEPSPLPPQLRTHCDWQGGSAA